MSSLQATYFLDRLARPGENYTLKSFSTQSESWEKILVLLWVISHDNLNIENYCC